MTSDTPLALRLEDIINAIPGGDVYKRQVCSDIENFKLINDVFGVPTGDRLLCAVADMYSRKTADRGICGRLNSDRFACLLEKRTDYTVAMFMEAIEQVNEEADIRNIAMKCRFRREGDALL